VGFERLPLGIGQVRRVGRAFSKHAAILHPPAAARFLQEMRS
jgi:hypothetical protein